MEDGTSMSVGNTEGTGRPGSRVEATDACEIRDLLDRLADKWSLLVVELLGDGKLRFNALRRQIPAISQRMLTLTLRNLERDGLVTRTVFAEVPPRVEYELTPLGTDLLVAVETLVRWTRAHQGEIVASRAAFDARADGRP